VLDNVQHGSHVFPDTGFQLRKDAPIAPQWRDLPDDQTTDIGGHLRGVRHPQAVRTAAYLPVAMPP
jgi:hypothetical protein